MKLNEEKEFELVKEILIKLGANEKQAISVANATVDADLKGFTSHGIGRFKQYIIGIKNGNINLEGDYTIERETEAICPLHP